MDQLPIGTHVFVKTQPRRLARIDEYRASRCRYALYWYDKKRTGDFAWARDDLQVVEDDRLAFLLLGLGD